MSKRTTVIPPTTSCHSLALDPSGAPSQSTPRLNKTAREKKCPAARCHASRKYGPGRPHPKTPFSGIFLHLMALAHSICNCIRREPSKPGYTNQSDGGPAHLYSGRTHISQEQSGPTIVAVPCRRVDKVLIILSFRQPLPLLGRDGACCGAPAGRAAACSLFSERGVEGRTSGFGLDNLNLGAKRVATISNTARLTPSPVVFWLPSTTPSRPTASNYATFSVPSTFIDSTFHRRHRRCSTHSFTATGADGTMVSCRHVFPSGRHVLNFPEVGGRRTIPHNTLFRLTLTNQAKSMIIIMGRVWSPG